MTPTLIPRHRPLRILLLALLLALQTGCHDHHDDHQNGHGHDHADQDDHDHAGPQTPGSRPNDDAHDHEEDEIHLTDAMVTNLGIRFGRAETRTIGRTLRLAGRFETPPAARRPYHAAVPGTVTQHVQPLQTVQKGDLLATIASPELLERRHELHVAWDGIGLAEDAERIANAKVTAARMTLENLEKRIKARRSAAAPSATLGSERVTLRQRLRVLRAEAAAAKREVVRAEHRFEAELERFSTQIGIPMTVLRQEQPGRDDHDEPVPLWETIRQLEVRAETPGVVLDTFVSSGAWTPVGERLLEVRDPSRVWLKLRALASDLAVLDNGQAVDILPESGADAAPLRGALRLGLEADPLAQTIPVYVPIDASPLPDFVKPGLAAFGEVQLGAGGAAGQVAVPARAVVRDGLHHIVFRRLPDEPDHVERIEVTLGARDARWVVVTQGLKAGDEVVVDGGWELKLGASAPAEAGHVHSDGTVHSGGH